MMDESVVRGRKYSGPAQTQDTRTQLKKWIPLVFFCFGLLCTVQTVNIYLRIGFYSRCKIAASDLDYFKTKTYQLIEERDKLETKLQNIDNHMSEGWLYFQGSFYLGSITERSWKQSRQYCQEKGADLLIINSDQEQVFAHRIFKGRRWIGLSDQEEEGVWKWVDGSPLNTSFWNSQEPNDKGGEDCGEFYFSTLDNWNDNDCSEIATFICEKKMD
ncbi:CD209 antigen-like protein D [Boleophthalmus pectinirostris]|uniref:CD209 antigen-like protein D n=1 Tax=Boleophthalmus pectinirostris TaxID=150288 RepID=UPI00242D6E77|nr:CD209 antigen-like protein D [Boleophthalmus pectinirostris]